MWNNNLKQSGTKNIFTVILILSIHETQISSKFHTDYLHSSTICTRNISETVSFPNTITHSYHAFTCIASL